MSKTILLILLSLLFFSTSLYGQMYYYRNPVNAIEKATLDSTKVDSLYVLTVLLGDSAWARLDSLDLRILHVDTLYCVDHARIDSLDTRRVTVDTLSISDLLTLPATVTGDSLNMNSIFSDSLHATWANADSLFESSTYINDLWKLDISDSIATLPALWRNDITDSLATRLSFIK